MDMSLDICGTIKDNDNLMIEAEVGIGKTLAYLIPSLYTIKHFKSSINPKLDPKKPVIICTSTIQLQEQLIEDIEIAKDITDIDINVQLGKGMSHYICQKKLIRNKNRIPTSLYEWAQDNYDDSSLPNHFKKDWKKINVKKCDYHFCDYHFDCYYNQMRNNINDHGNAELIVINQDFFIANLLKKEESGEGFLNSRAKLIIIDEAHNFEEKSRNALTRSWKEKRFYTILNKSHRKSIRNMDKRKEIESIKSFINNLFNQIQKTRLDKIKNSKHDIIRFSLPEIKEEKLDQVINDLKSIYHNLDFESNTSKIHISNLLDELLEMLLLFEELKKPVKKSSYLFWVEGLNESKRICFAPKNLDQKLKKLLFKKKTPTILTSATLCQPGDALKEKYKYQINSLGFQNKESYLGTPKKSPFPYNKNAKLYIPNDITNYKKDRDLYLTEISNRIIDLAKITKGRSLVLFTSKKDLSSVYDKLISNKIKFEILKQKKGSSHSDVIKKFRKTKGILLATGTFWEGIDIKGPDLSSVIIARLPFPQPDPIIDFKMSNAEKNLDVLLPKMTMKLRQGAGRLIRSKKDTGILSILDSRISSKADTSYKKQAIESLPIKNPTDSLSKIKKFASEKILNKYN